MRELRLETDRLVLREFREDDWRGLHAIESLEEVNRYQDYDLHTAERSRDYVKRIVADAAAEPRVVIDLAITKRGDDTPIGRIGFRRSGHELRTGEIWFVLAPGEQHQGLVTEAARAVIDMAFRALGMHRLYGDCDPRNTRSAALMERLGFRREAHFVQNVFIKGEWVDSLIYAVLAREWPGSPG